MSCRFFAPGSLALLWLGLVACDAGSAGGTQTGASTGSGSGSGGSGGAGDGGAATTATTTASSSASTAEASSASVSTSVSVSVSVSVGTSTGTGGNEPVAEVFAHSGSILYRLALDTEQIEEVGTFSGCMGSVLDIALDEDSNMFGTTFDGLFRIDRTTAACSLVAAGTFPNSLSFVPAGTLDPNVESLVGYVDADYVRINPSSGQVTTVRQNALPSGLISSGDIVSVKDGPTLLTVKGGSCSDADCVVEVDPATGQSLTNFGSTGYTGVFGVAYWDGKLFGFTRNAEVFAFTNDAGGIATTVIPIQGSPMFYGAGSTTSAPKGIFD